MKEAFIKIEKLTQTLVIEKGHIAFSNWHKQCPLYQDVRLITTGVEVQFRSFSLAFSSRKPYLLTSFSMSTSFFRKTPQIPSPRPSQSACS